MPNEIAALKVNKQDSNQNSDHGHSTGNNTNTSAETTALTFLHQVSRALKPSQTDWITNFNNDAEAHGTLSTLPGGMKIQAVDKVVSDMKDKHLMHELGLTGSFAYDDKGNVASITFNSPAMEHAYKSEFDSVTKVLSKSPSMKGYSRDQIGKTAEERINSVNPIKDDARMGHIEFDVNAKNSYLK